MSVDKIIQETIGEYTDPFLETDLVTAGVLKTINTEKEAVVVKLEFGYPLSADKIEHISRKLGNRLQQAMPEKKIHLDIAWQVKPHAIQTGLKNLAQVKNIIAIASGKGGVGKSTTAVNLALGLSSQGGAVGLLDADIYGPNQPQMLGINHPPEFHQAKQLHPITAFGLQTMSIGYLVDQKTPMIWRGPMVTSALLQLLNDTLWQDLDYLIIDLPPGTGDIQLTLAQKIPVSGAIIVTTPQEVALQDARKGIAMFQKVKIPILGIVENMSTFICPHCDHAEAIFGTKGGESLAAEYQLNFLGDIPLVKNVREHADAGEPITYAEPHHEVSQRYIDIALKMAAKLSLQQRSFGHHFPKITIENN